MKIAVLSDTHDNIWKLAEAIPHLAQADRIIHCGDLCSPFVVKQLGEGAPGIRIDVVWGNNDGDKRALEKLARKAGNIHIHGEFAELEVDGLKIAVNHYPEIGAALARSGQYDLVCYGHDHIANEEIHGETLLLNPGEIMGLFGRRTLAVYSTEDRKVEWIELE